MTDRPTVEVTGWTVHGPASPTPNRVALHLWVDPRVDRAAVHARLVEAVRDLAWELRPTTEEES